MTNILSVDKNLPRSLPILIVGLLFSFLIIKIFSGHWTEDQYYLERGDVLNILAGTQGSQSLEFYLGRIEERLWGPLGMLFSGIGFLLISWYYLKETDARRFFLAVFLYFLFTKFDILLYPIYGDSASGPFVEAVWLKANNFNYFRLAQQPVFVQGGPKCYLFSIYPTFQAILMTLIPHTKLFLLVNHLLTFALGAAIVAAFRDILLKIFSKNLALLVSLLLLSLPLFQSQVEQINMEIPLLFFSVLAVHCLVNKKMGLAALMSMMAVFAKGVGIIITISFFIVCLLLFFLDKEYRFKGKLLILGAVAIIYSAVQYYAAFFILNQKGQVDMVGLFEGWRWMKSWPLVYLFGISCIIFLGNLLKEKWGKARLSIFDLFQKYYIPLIMFICAGVWFGLYLNSYGDQYRYRLLLLPFCLFSLLYTGYVLVRKEDILQGILVILTGFSFWCSYGWIYPEEEDNIHAVLERSLEYRNEIKVTRKAAKLLETSFSDFTVGAPFTYAQILAFPEMGYVRHGFNVIIYGFPCTYGNIKPFSGFKDLDLDKVIWVGIKESNLIDQMSASLIAEEDKIIQEVFLGNKKITLFMGGIAIERMRLMLKEMLRIMQRKGIINNSNRQSFGLDLDNLRSQQK